MKQSFFPSAAFPLVIQPDADSRKASLLQYIKDNRKAFDEAFFKYGAVLFRGFDLDTPKDFEDVALQVDPRLKNDYYGTSPRNIVKNTNYIFTASELPGYYPIPQHCEMSYVEQPPISLFFYCHIEPAYGGETPLCDFRKVYAELHPDIRQEFDNKGVLTVRNYSSLENASKFNLFELKKWNEIFNTTERAEVERQCRQQHIDFQWMPNGNLRLTHRTSASRKNPVTGEPAWFNHLQVFNPYAAKVEYDFIHQRQQRGKTFLWKHLINAMVKVKQATKAPIDQSMNVLFGDGTEIPNSYVQHVQEVIWKNMVIFPWKKNDVIAIDNFSVAHGRLPYEGAREILVCWSA
ncbi:MAG: TauD/TfdA family dioxygenase [Bacteroidetes bacterium]|nr:TauD/TfdA family dioxygenase [Bacteroidota bacterium]MBK8659480.1 TauD/TfdA family dioxygenase [Bacteroidota bacterium]